MVPCEECPDNARNEDTYLSSGGGHYFFDNDNWTRNDGELSEIVITNRNSNSSLKQRGISFSGEMPEWMRLRGMDDYYNNVYKPELDANIASMHQSQATVGAVVAQIAAAPFLIGGLAAGGGGALLFNTGYRGFLARAGLDASIQYGITGDVDLISSTASGIGFRKFGLMANVGAASTDFTINGVRQSIFDGSKPLLHAGFDFLGGFGPNFTRAVSSPSNSLGPAGIYTTGTAGGTWVSEMLKKQ